LKLIFCTCNFFAKRAELGLIFTTFTLFPELEVEVNKKSQKFDKAEIKPVK
jgi:hypothetical protein